ncbi:VOC family protein [Dinghuibacter silviterrae]|uniref:PhnB protein n=1 Tax=Dinghuibacter silviterrae TaxID=1539049 RepID=A0A4R8DPT1_9BACT|nr:VOC family protein [Dinghuibacter silviterrae]TDW99130.1 PhnB protein [Dinghuibacter silviterrae]
MTQIHAYIHFNGRCREAMTFYKECLGADLELVEGGQRIVHASLSKGDLLLMGSDMHGPYTLIQGNSISLSLNCGSEEEIHVFFQRLSINGEVVCDLMTQTWGALFGVVRDRFGLTWMLNYDRQTQP